MNKKGESQVAVITVMAVALLVALAFLPTIFGAQKQMTDTFYVRNVTVTLGNNGTWTDLPYQEYDGTLLFQNATVTATPISSANFSVREEVSASKNVKRVQISPCGASTCGWNSSTINVSGTFGLEGYVDDAGGRSIAGMIGLFSSLAVFAICLFYWAKGNGWISGF
jgi:hypothetical protein